MKRFADDRIIYVRHETNKGIGVARNTGVLNSSGEYIAFLDDDDAWLPQKLELQCKLLDSSPANVGVVYTGGYTFDWKSKNTTPKDRLATEGTFSTHCVPAIASATSSRVMVRKSCFDKVGLFDDALVFGEDFDMWVRLAREFQFEFVEEPLILYTRHEVKLSTNHAKRLAAPKGFSRNIASICLRMRRDYARTAFLCSDFCIVTMVK